AMACLTAVLAAAIPLPASADPAAGSSGSLNEPAAPDTGLPPDDEADIRKALESEMPVSNSPAPGGPPQWLQRMNPDLSVILDVALAGFSSDPLQLGGHDP